MRFEGQVVFITGGTHGLGKAMAEEFLKEGASVGVCGIPEEAVARFEEEFKGKPVLAFHADVTDYAAMEDVAAKTMEKWGKVDVLINNAGVVNALGALGKNEERGIRQIDRHKPERCLLCVPDIRQKDDRREVRADHQYRVPGRPFRGTGFSALCGEQVGLMVMARTLAYEWSKFGVTA